MLTKFNTLILIVLAVIMFSCKSDNGTDNTKDDDNNNNNNNGLTLGTFEAVIDGKEWKCNNAMALINTIDQLQVSCSFAYGNEMESLGITLPIIKTPGTYKEGDGRFQYQDNSDISKIRHYMSTDPIDFTITSISDTEISGTFSFEAMLIAIPFNKIKVEKGKFRCSIIKM
jgi:hypothetical protein